MPVVGKTGGYQSVGGFGMKKELRSRISKHRKSICIFGVFLMLGLTLYVKEQAEQKDGAMEVVRGEEGSGTGEQTFTYRADGKTQEVTVDVHARERSPKDVQKLLDEAVEEWESRFLGKNKSQNQVMDHLDLPESLCDGLVTVSYESSDPILLDTEGTVSGENVTEEGSLVRLRAEFSYGEYCRVEDRWLRLILPPEGSVEWLHREVQREISQIEASSRQKGQFSLPDTVKGHRLQWENAQEFTWMYMIFLGAAAVFCLEWKQKEDVRKAEKKRKDQLLYEYPQMVEQMSLLLGSGMTILGAWERLIRTTERIQRNHGGEEKLFPGEMNKTFQEIRKGCGEKAAYERFGARIGLIPYRRFASILSQNLSKGTRDVRELLAAEAREAFEMRKNNARRRGEEAGTKLLFPMFVMFGLILLVLLLPAVQNF